MPPLRPAPGGVGTAVTAAVTIGTACSSGSSCTRAAIAADAMAPAAAAAAIAAPHTCRSLLPLVPAACCRRPTLSVMRRPCLLCVFNLTPLPLVKAPDRQPDVLCRCIAAAVTAVAAGDVPAHCSGDSCRCIASVAVVQPVCCVGRKPAAIGMLRCSSQRGTAAAATAAAAVPLPPPSPAACTLEAMEAVVLCYALQTRDFVSRRLTSAEKCASCAFVRGRAT